MKLFFVIFFDHHYDSWVHSCSNSTELIIVNMLKYAVYDYKYKMKYEKDCFGNMFLVTVSKVKITFYSR